MSTQGSPAIGCPAAASATSGVAPALRAAAWAAAAICAVVGPFGFGVGSTFLGSLAPAPDPLPPEVARLRPGPEPSKPQVEVHASEFLDGAQRERLRARLAKFVEGLVTRELGSIAAVEAKAEADNTLRGPAYLLREALGD